MKAGPMSIPKPIATPGGTTVRIGSGKPAAYGRTRGTTGMTCGATPTQSSSSGIPRNALSISSSDGTTTFGPATSSDRWIDWIFQALPRRPPRPRSERRDARFLESLVADFRAMPPS